MTSNIPVLYRVFFHYFEPFAALNGAYLAYFHPSSYLRQTNFPITDDVASPDSTVYALKHLASTFVLFAFAEALVLRNTRDLGVYKALLVSMLACDLVWMSAIRHMGGDQWFWLQPWQWDATSWGNFGSSWIALIFRVLFLAGVGLPNGD